MSTLLLRTLRRVQCVAKLGERFPTEVHSYYNVYVKQNIQNLINSVVINYCSILGCIIMYVLVEITPFDV